MIELECVSKICQHCQKEFLISIFRKSTAKFCSRLCKDFHQKGQVTWNKGLKKSDYANRQKKTVLKKNNCLRCGIPVVNKYCSHSCQRGHQNM